MSVDDSREQYWRDAQKRRTRETPPTGGGNDGIEARVARLESDMSHVKKGVDRVESSLSDITKTLTAVQLDISKGVGEIKVGIATLTERSRHFPTRWDVFLMLVALLTAIGVVVALAVRFIPA